MFKVNNKDTRTTSLTSFWCLYCLLWTYFTPFCSASIVDHLLFFHPSRYVIVRSINENVFVYWMSSKRVNNYSKSIMKKMSVHRLAERLNRWFGGGIWQIGHILEIRTLHKTFKFNKKLFVVLNRLLLLITG